MQKRILSILLAIVMVVGLIPGGALTAFAAETGSEVKWGADADSLTEEGTLADAIAADAAYIQLLKNITYNEQLTINNSVTLDLNGKTLTATGEDGVSVTGDLTITDSSTAGNGSLIGTATGRRNSYGVYVNYGNITVKGGSLTGKNTGNGIENHGVCVNNGSIIVESGSLTGTSTDTDGWGSGVFVENGYITVSGGRLTGSSVSDYGVCCFGYITVEGEGKLTGTGATAVQIVYEDYSSYTKQSETTDETTGLTTVVLVAKVETPADPEVKYGASADASLNEGTLADAIAVDAAYIQLLKNITYNEQLTINNSVTLDLNGQTLTATGDNGVYVTGALTITDSSTDGNGSLIGTATGKNTRGVYVSGNLTVKGGSLTGKNTGSGLSKYGVFVNGGITVSGGSLNGTAGEGDGVRAMGDITVSDGSLNGTAGEADGVYTLGSISVSGGSLTGTATVGNGVFVKGGITVSGGSLTGTSASDCGVRCFGYITVEGEGKLTGTGETPVQIDDEDYSSYTKQSEGTDETTGLPTVVLVAKVETPVITEYPLWVGGEQVTSANADDVFGDGKVSFTPAEGDTPDTLTLNNYSYTGEGYNDAAIYYGGANTLKLNLVGDNSVTHSSDTGLSYGVYADNGGIEISGDKLTTTGGAVTGFDSGSNGIRTMGDITILSGTVTATSGEAYGSHGSDSTGISVVGKFTVLGGTVTAIGGKSTSDRGGGSAGIWAYEDITISGGETIAKGETAAFGQAPTIDDTLAPFDEDGKVIGNPDYDQLKYVHIKAKPTVASVTVGSTTTNYPDIKSAVAAAQANSGSTLTLLDNISVNEYFIVERGTFTIDLNGKTWESSKWVMFIGGDADITITDNSTNKEGKLFGAGSSYPTIMLYGNANLEIAGGTVEDDTSYVIDMAPGGNPSQAKFTLSGGKLITKDLFSIGAFGSSVAITGGTIESAMSDIYYSTGMIALSGHSDPTGITIYLDSRIESCDIKLPDGYVLLDKSGKVAATLEKLQTYTVGKTHSVSISAVDAADGVEIADATMQLLDKQGDVVSGWISGISAKQITDLKSGVEYTIRTAVAPDGYTVPADVIFTIDGEGKVTTSGTITKDGVLLVKFAETAVKVSAVDADGNPLEGADMLILNADYALEDKWTSGTEVHETTGLKTGVEYTLRAAVVPEGYAVPADVNFSIDAEGKVTTSGDINEDGVLLVKFDKVSYEIMIPADSGAVVTTNKENPVMGDKVIITVKPDEGKEVVEVVVKDKDGNPVDVIPNDDGTYTYEQPAGNVTIEVTFRNPAWSDALIEWPTEIDLGTYDPNRTLDDISLAEFTTEFGYFVWASPTDVPETSDKKLEVKFIPSTYAKQNYTGVPAEAKAEISVTLEPKTITASLILSQTVYPYDGGAKKPEVTVMDGSSTIPASEYKVSYSNNTGAGTAVVTVSDKNGGNYIVSGAAIFTILPREEEVTLYTVIFDGNNDNVSGIPAAQTVPDGSKLAEPSAPVKEDYELIGWSTDKAGENLWKFKADKVTENITLYAQWKQVMFDIDGDIHDKDDNVLDHSIRILVKQGSRVFMETTTNEAGHYSLRHVPAGVYNIVAMETDGRTVTTKVEITDRSETVATVKLPAENVSSELEVPAGTPDIVVGGLDDLAKNHAEDKPVEEQPHVTVFMVVEQQEDLTGDSHVSTDDAEMKEIQDAIVKKHKESSEGSDAEEERDYTFLTIDISKTTETKNGVTTESIDETGDQLVEIIVPYETAGRKNFKVYRHHGTEIHELTTIDNGNGEFIEIGDGFITIHAKKFSTYAISSVEDLEQTPEEPENPVEVENVAIEGAPSEVVNPGTSISLSADVSGTNLTDGDQKVNWSVLGNTDENTRITADGRLIIGENEKASSLTVMAQSEKDPTKIAVLTITLAPKTEPEPDDKEPENDSFDYDAWYRAVMMLRRKQALEEAAKAEKPEDAAPETGWQNPFKDVAETDWFYEDVEFVNETGLMIGTNTAGTKFSPEDTLTRAMLVTILWRLESEPVVNYFMQFNDVVTDEWYTEAVRWAAAEGIVNGYGDDTFGPMNAVTREQAMAILHRYAAYKGLDRGILFPMIPQYDYSLWAENDILWADMVGLTSGLGVDIFDMTASADRAEIAAYLRRFCEAFMEE